MPRGLPLLLALAVLLAACGAQARERAPAAGLVATIERPLLNTSTPLPPDTPTPRSEATPAPTRISEVLPAVEPPSAQVTGGTSLALPDGTTVVWDGCASDGRCYPYNFYWAPTHEIVMQPGEPPYKVQHELCHAHQHWTINRGDTLPPSDYDLQSWYQTAEGQSFSSAVAFLPWPWSHSTVNALEDFAWTCAYWYVDPAYLFSASPQRFDWATANLP